ncbi:uncharacterized protein [Nicotiana sylvestris]|uniref:uncharacterized protein n=1 Tax=Nicotiana sylvestris TaxID=4096 RepID=UPI00388CE31F
MEVSKPAKGNKRKGKEVADPSVTKKPKPHRPKTAIGTSASAFEANLGTDDENDDESGYHLEERLRPDVKAPQIPQPKAAESGTADSGELRDAQDTNATKAGDPLKGGGTLGDILGDVSGNVDLDTPSFVKAAERFMQQCKEMYDHALFRLNGELSCREKELEKLSSILRESEARFAQKEKESGTGDFSEMRPFSLGEEKRLPNSVSRVDNKQKKSSGCEEAYSGASPSQRIKRGDLTDHSVSGTSVLERTFPVSADGASGDTKPSDIGSAFGEASGSALWLKFELLRYEARLRRTVDREKSLKLFCKKKESELVNVLIFQLESKMEELERLWGEVGRAKREFDELQAHVDAQVAAKESVLAKVSTLEMQIRTARASDSARANMIARLESELSKTKAEVMNARAEAVMSSTRADQRATAYLKNAATAKVELRRTLGRASSSKEYVKCKSRRETLEEVHARGFDLS